MQIQNQLFFEVPVAGGGGNPGETFYRITESGDRRVLEDGSPRAIE